VNGAKHPARVAARVNDSVQVGDGSVTVTLPPISWTVLSLSTRV
jgi:alpha-N-arabinofuranosidase